MEKKKEKNRWGIFVINYLSLKRITNINNFHPLLNVCSIIIIPDNKIINLQLAITTEQNMIYIRFGLA